MRKVKLTPKGIYWWLFVIKLSLRWIPRLNLGAAVWHEGEKWTLAQGVCRPKWDLQKGMRRKKHVHENEFKKVRSLKNYWHSFSSGYRFYMGYWYDSWVRGGVKPWMLGCRIWAKE